MSVNIGDKVVILPGAVDYGVNESLVGLEGVVIDKFNCDYDGLVVRAKFKECTLYLREGVFEIVKPTTPRWLIRKVNDIYCAVDTESEYLDKYVYSAETVEDWDWEPNTDVTEAIREYAVDNGFMPEQELEVVAFKVGDQVIVKAGERPPYVDEDYGLRVGTIDKVGSEYVHVSFPKSNPWWFEPDQFEPFAPENGKHYRINTPIGEKIAFVCIVDPELNWPEGEHFVFPHDETLDGYPVDSPSVTVLEEIV